MTTINVTAEHIAKGKRRDCQSCPVALAIRDALPDVGVVKVGSEGLVLGNIPHLVELDLPKAVADFIWYFDDSGLVKPFAFELDCPAVAA